MQRLRFFACAFLLLTVSPTAHAGSISFEFEGQSVAKFEAYGVTYFDLHRLVSRFAGTSEDIAASPPGTMTLVMKDTSWPEILTALYSPTTFDVQRNASGQLIISRKPVK